MIAHYERDPEDPHRLIVFVGAGSSPLREIARSLRAAIVILDERPSPQEVFANLAATIDAWPVVYDLIIDAPPRAPHWMRGRHPFWRRFVGFNRPIHSRADKQRMVKPSVRMRFAPSARVVRRAASRWSRSVRRAINRSRHQLLSQ